MSKHKDSRTGKLKYFIPIDGKYYETTEEVHTIYYKMDRRERYLQEQCNKKELSYDGLEVASYPIETRLRVKPLMMEDQVMEDFLVDKMLKCLTKLSVKDRWIIEEVFFNGKSAVELSKITGIPRRTIQSRKDTAIDRLKKLMVENNYI